MTRAIRPGEPADFERVVDIFNAAIPTRMSVAEPEAVPYGAKQDWYFERAPNRPLDILEVGNEIVGWVELKDHYGRAAYAKTAEIAVYVAQEHLGRGHGRYLLNQMLGRCPQLGITSVLAVCFAHNDASVKLFKSVGFEEWGFYPGIAELDGISRDLVHLGLKV